jgi:NAD(P)H-hydrate repair Nnr-like enzyme with NAD(P)H-hydrate epimerase domain
VTLDDLPELQAVPSVTAAQMAEVDRITIVELGVSVDRLMENASRQVAQAARALLGGRVAGKRIIGLIGGGNNGADTAGALRHLINWGAAVVPAIAAPRHRLREATLRDVTRLGELGLFQATHFIDASLGFMPVMAADLLLDGLLGYSAHGPPRTEMARLIEAANSNGARSSRSTSRQESIRIAARRPELRSEPRPPSRSPCRKRASCRHKRRRQSER